MAAQYNWMKTGATMGKYQPYLAAAAGYIVSAGAWSAEGGSGELTAIKIDPSSGEIAARYTPSAGDESFLSAAVEKSTGKLAVAYSSSGLEMGVLFLDGDFRQLADEKTNIAIRSDLAWTPDGSVWIAGWLKGAEKFVNHPACEQLDPSSSAAAQQSNWPEAQAVDALDVALVDGTCLVAYAENLSGKPDSVDNSRVVVRKCSGGGDPLFSYHQGNVYQGNPILEPFEGGFWLALYHGAEGPVLVKFKKG